MHGYFAGDITQDLTAHGCMISARQDDDNYITVDCKGLFSIRVPLNVEPNPYGYVQCFHNGKFGRMLCKVEKGKGNVSHSLSFVDLDNRVFSLQAFLYNE